MSKPFRQPRPQAPRQYLYRDDVECEENGHHRVEPKVWPPVSRTGEASPSVALTCKLCGSWCIVYGDNDPDKTGYDVIMPVQGVRI